MYVYFLTIRSYRGLQFASVPDLSRRMVDSLIRCRERQDIRLYAYCLMPDHLHLAVSPLGGKTIPQVLQAYKSYTTREAWAVGHSGPLWQRSYYDHVARGDEDCVAICRYILDNPVRKGLVAEAADWPWSDLVDPLPG